MKYSNVGVRHDSATHKMLNNLLIGGVGCLTVALTSVALSAAPTRAVETYNPLHGLHCSGGDTVKDNKLCLQLVSNDTVVNLTKQDGQNMMNSTQLVAVSRRSYGMVLTMQAKNSNLVNESDPTQYISSTEVEGSDGLAANQWGVVTSYGISKGWYYKHDNAQFEVAGGAEGKCSIANF